METLLGKIEVILNWRWKYYEENFKSFYEVISVKSKNLRKNLTEILKKYRKHFAQTFKKHVDGYFVKFSRQFLEEFCEKL